MTTQAGVFIALGLVIAAWIGKANIPPEVANAIAWILALIGTLLLLAAAFGWHVLGLHS